MQRNNAQLLPRTATFTCVHVSSNAKHAHVQMKPHTATYVLENVEHCGGEPEQADTGYYVTDE